MAANCITFLVYSKNYLQFLHFTHLNQNLGFATTYFYNFLSCFFPVELPKDPPKLVLKDKESVSQLQENRPRITSQLLHDKLLPQASPNNKPYLFNGNSCPCNHLEALDASKRAKITGKKKMARAEKASEEAPSSSQANTSKFQSDQWLEIESTSSGLTLADLLREKRAEVEHLVPLIQKADRVIPKSHAADAEKIPLSTTWDIALANLLRVCTFYPAFWFIGFLFWTSVSWPINKLLSRFMFYVSRLV